MRASKYFPAKKLLSIETVLFEDLVQENTRYPYCLINESMRTFYVSESVNVAGVIARLRLLVKGADYPLLAHQVQGAAAASNMVDWVLGVFGPNQNLDEIVKIMREKHGFAQYYREAPYGANGVEMIKLYSLSHRASGFTFYFASVKGPLPNVISRAASHHLARAINYLNGLGTTHGIFAAKQLQRVKDHTYAAEWTVREVNMNVAKELQEIRLHTASLNLKATKDYMAVVNIPKPR